MAKDSLELLACLYLMSAGSTGVHHHAVLFSARDQTQGFGAARQVLPSQLY